MVKANSIHKVCKVGFSHLNYQTLTPNLFTILPSVFNSVQVGGKANFKAVFSGKDNLIEQSVDNIAHGLFSVFQSIGTVPYLKLQNGTNDISEKVGRKLQSIYQNFYNESDDSFSTSKASSKDRPLLIVVDRNIDLHTMFHHSWNYLLLIADIFSLKNNQFVYQENAQSKADNFDLDFGADELLTENYFKDFPEVTEKIDKTLNSWKEEYDRLTQKTGNQNSLQSNQSQDISSSLSSAIDQIPQMTERKKKIDMHVQIATKILS